MNIGEINYDLMFKLVGWYNVGGLNQVRGEFEIDGYFCYKNCFYFIDDVLEIVVKLMINILLGVLFERIREGVNVVYDQVCKVGYVEDFIGQVCEFFELMGWDMVEVEFLKVMEYISVEWCDLKESIVGIGQNGVFDDYYLCSRDFSVQFKDVIVMLKDLCFVVFENIQWYDVVMVRELVLDVFFMCR